MEPSAPSGVVPVWLGGGSQPAVTRAARIGDGWLAAAGATEILLNPLHDLPGQLERLAEVRGLLA